MSTKRTDQIPWAADPEFDAWVKTLPEKTWAKTDLSACRLGWEAHKSAQMMREREVGGAVTSSPDPETMCAMWITPSTSDAEASAYLTGARAMLAARRAAVTDGWKPTDDEVREWLARSNLDDDGRLEHWRTVIDDARSMHMLAPAPEAVTDDACRFPNCECSTSGFDRNCEAVGRVVGQGEREVGRAVTDAEIMAEWFSANGSVHGPHVETVTMPQVGYLRFRRSFAAPRAAVPDGWKLPNRKTGTTGTAYEMARNDGWNACLDFIEREAMLAAAPEVTE